LTGVGTSLLIQTATEQSSASYYGEQGLHYVDIKGESCLVPRGSYPILLFLSLFCSVQLSWTVFILSHVNCIFSLCWRNNAVSNYNTHDTWFRNRRHKSTPFSRASFWCVCHAYLAPHSSGTRFRRRLEHCSIPSLKVACTRLKWWLVIGRWQTLTFIMCFLVI